MTPSLEGWSTKAKEAPSPHEVQLAPLDTNPVFQSLWGKGLENTWTVNLDYHYQILLDLDLELLGL